MGDQGLLSNAQEKALAKIVDDAVKAKGILELVDGYAAQVLISQIDDQLLNKIQIDESLKANIRAIVDAAIAEDVDLAESLGADLLNQVVDIPGIDEDAELMIFKGALNIIVGAILTKVRTKGSQPPAPGTGGGNG